MQDMKTASCTYLYWPGLAKPWRSLGHFQYPETMPPRRTAADAQMRLSLNLGQYVASHSAVPQPYLDRPISPCTQQYNATVINGKLF
jgi:hypothetical protein